MRYIAAEFERLGLEPAGDDGGWLQRFDIVGMKSEVTTPMTLHRAGGKPLVLKPVDESVVAPGLQQEAVGVQATPRSSSSATASPRPSRSGTTTRTSTCAARSSLVMNNDPEDDPALFAGKTRLYYGRWDYKYDEAARHGAAGVIIIHTEHSAGYPWQVVQSSWSGEQFELPAGRRAAPRAQDVGDRGRRRSGSPRSAARTSTSCARAAESRDFRPVPLGVKLTAGAQDEARRARAPPTCSACCPAAIPSSQASSWSSRRTTITSACATAQGDDDLQRRARQRLGRGGDARSIAEALADARAAAQALDPVRRRRRRGVGPARQRVLLRAPARAARPDRRQPQHRRHQHLGQHHATSASSASASRRSTTSSSPSRRRRAAPSPPTISPTRAPSIAAISSTSPRSACRRSTSRRACATPATTPQWGRDAAREVRPRALPPAERSDRRDLEPRRRGRRRAAHGRRRCCASPTPPKLPEWQQGRRVRGRAQEGARRVTTSATLAQPLLALL